MLEQAFGGGTALVVELSGGELDRLEPRAPESECVVALGDDDVGFRQRRPVRPEHRQLDIGGPVVHAVMMAANPADRVHARPPADRLPAERTMRALDRNVRPTRPASSERNIRATRAFS